MPLPSVVSRVCTASLSRELAGCATMRLPASWVDATSATLLRCQSRTTLSESPGAGGPHALNLSRGGGAASRGAGGPSGELVRAWAGRRRR
jgi:hypothetical protein